MNCGSTAARVRRRCWWQGRAAANGCVSRSNRALQCIKSGEFAGVMCHVLETTCSWTSVDSQGLTVCRVEPSKASITMVVPHPRTTQKLEHPQRTGLSLLSESQLHELHAWDMTGTPDCPGCLSYVLDLQIVEEWNNMKHQSRAQRQFEKDFCICIPKMYESQSKLSRRVSTAPRPQ